MELEKQMFGKQMSACISLLEQISIKFRLGSLVKVKGFFLSLLFSHNQL